MEEAEEEKAGVGVAVFEPKLEIEIDVIKHGCCCGCWWRRSCDEDPWLVTAWARTLFGMERTHCWLNRRPHNPVGSRPVLLGTFEVLVVGICH